MNPAWVWCAKSYPSTQISATGPSSRPVAPTMFAIIKYPRRQWGTLSCHIPDLVAVSSLHLVYLFLFSQMLFGNQALSAAHSTARAQPGIKSSSRSSPIFLVC